MRRNSTSTVVPSKPIIINWPTFWSVVMLVREIVGFGGTVLRVSMLAHPMNIEHGAAGKKPRRNWAGHLHSLLVKPTRFFRSRPRRFIWLQPTRSAGFPNPRRRRGYRYLHLHRRRSKVGT